MAQVDASAQRKILNRLNRARGQLNAVIAAVERGDDCTAVVTQLSAVGSALDRAGFQIIATAMKDCLVDSRGETDVAIERLTLPDLEKLFLSLA
ncbi:MAG: metal-sensitive transcriptional regulator [Microbacterium sp.]|uniref:metal-sensitive transcriptional regulator n=1 Tax=Microbacterium sp. TaxID=51671 RepID=UPI002605BCF3|nr:metal-sensitive transcriptional regulator [Microbacterium sp.]MCX6501321.1 metal-sensitive transcriptional regulator [Microbacterium sp.]